MSDLSGVALVSSAYVFLAMNFMPFGPTAGMVGANAAHKHWGNRIFQNTLEHAPLFLTMLWTHAAFVSAPAATARPTQWSVDG